MPLSFGKHAREISDLVVAMDTAAFEEKVSLAIKVLCDALRARKPVLVFGNGGSASDAQHIAAELAGRFSRERPAFNVIALPANAALLTAWSNDYDYETVFARQIEAHGVPGGIAWALSTSGNSPSVLRGLEAARRMGLVTIGFGGEGGGRMAPLCDLLLEAPSRITPRTQELHAVLYHYICECVEAVLSGEPGRNES